MRGCTSAFIKSKKAAWGQCLPLSWKNRQASMSGGWTWLILHWETSKESHGAGGSVVRSAVGGTLPFEMVLNHCQEEGRGRGPFYGGNPGPASHGANLRGSIEVTGLGAWKNLSFRLKNTRWKQSFAHLSSVEIPCFILYRICWVG